MKLENPTPLLERTNLLMPVLKTYLEVGDQQCGYVLVTIGPKENGDTELCVSTNLLREDAIRVMRIAAEDVEVTQEDGTFEQAKAAQEERHGS